MTRSRTTFSERVWPVFKFAIAFALLALIIAEISHESMRLLWTRVSMPWFVVSIIAFYVAVWCMARRYWVILGATLNFQDVFQVVLYQALIGNLLTTTAGAAWYIGTLRHEQNVQVARSLLSLALARFGDLVVFLPSLIVVTIILWSQIATLHSLVLLMIFLAIASLTIVTSMIVFRRLFAVVIHKILNRLALAEKPIIKKAIVTLESLSNEIDRQSPKAIGHFILLSLLTVGSMLCFAYSSLQIFDVKIGMSPVILVVAVTQIISLLPIQVLGGLGVYDYTYLYLYGAFGIERPELIGVIVGLRISYYLANLCLLPLVALTAQSAKARSHCDLVK